MRIFYDNTTQNVTIENVNKYFSSGSLVAVADGSNVQIKYLNTDKFEVYDLFSNFQKEDGTPAGTDSSTVVTYLNSQFNRGLVKGVSSFSGLGNSKTISDSRVATGDVVMIQPIGSLLNEVLYVAVVSGAFTVTRSVIVSITGLTSDLNFFWIKM